MYPEGLHQHCERCYSLHCQAPVNTSVSCVVIKCHLDCGAAFHKCKEEEHQLLCPNEMVPCLNVDYGCPFTLLRHRLAKHLEVCPASTVICSQQWIRFPVADTDSSIYRTTLADPEKQLNVSMALRDQELLFRCLKMKTVFPELMEKVWEFSSLFSKVDRWCFDDVPSMSEHLKVCPFYQREELSQPVKLASMEGARERPQGLLDLSQEYDLPLADQ